MQDNQTDKGPEIPLGYGLLFEEVQEHIYQNFMDYFEDDPIYEFFAYMVWLKIEVILRWHQEYEAFFRPELEKYLLSPERPAYPWEGWFMLWTDPGSRMNLFANLSNRFNLFGRKDYPARVCFDYTGMVSTPLGGLGSHYINDWKQEWKSTISGFESPIPRFGFDHWLRLTPKGWANENDIYIDLHPFRDRTWFLLHLYGKDFWIKPE